MENLFGEGKKFPKQSMSKETLIQERVFCYVETMTNLSTIEQQTNISLIIPLSIFKIMDPTCQKYDAIMLVEQDVMLGNEYKDYEILDYINCQLYGKGNSKIKVDYYIFIRRSNISLQSRIDKENMEP